MTIKQPRILIVGAGPTGLTLANTLKRFDVSFDIIDQKKGLSSTSKGLSINMLSQITFSILKIRNRVGSNGKKIRKLSLFNDKRRILSCDFSYLDGKKYLIIQPQSITEKELHACLIEDHDFIAWGTKLVSITTSISVATQSKRYKVYLETEGNKLQYNEYDYIIGCEGKNSVVRDYIGADFSGSDYAMYILLADFVFESEILLSEVQYIQFEQEFLIIIPMSARKYRTVTISRTKLETSDEISEKLTRIINSYYRVKIVSCKAFWTSSAKIYLRVADKLCRNGLFICGDSCHLVSPIGGTGMNMGIQDAFNLGCKLASVIKSYQPQQLLQHYEKERLAVIKEICLNTDTTTKMIFDLEFRNKNTDLFTPTFSKRQWLRESLPFAYSGLSIRYPSKNNLQIDNTYEKSYFGCLYRPIENVYCNVDFYKIKPTIIVTIGDNYLDEKNNTIVQMFADNIRLKYKTLFYFLYISRKKKKLEGFKQIPLNKIHQKLPEDSVFIINTEGFIEYGCPLKKISSMYEYIKKYYLEQYNIEKR